MDSFQNCYAAAVTFLFDALPKEGGVPEASLAAAEKQHSIRLPAALRDYYRELGNCTDLNEAHNRLLAPQQWFRNAGKLVFLVENQAVVYWGVDALSAPDDDPPVYHGVNNLPAPIFWHREHAHCSEFLIIMLHWQAVCGGLDWLGMADAGSEIGLHLQKTWQPVGVLDGLRAFRRQGQAACLLDSGDLFVGARTERAFQAICSELEKRGVELNVF